MFLLFVLIYEGAVRNESLSILSRNLSLQYYPFHLHKCIFMQCKPLQNENRYGISKKGFSRGSEYFFFQRFMSPSFDFYTARNQVRCIQKIWNILAAFLTPNREWKNWVPLDKLYFFFLPFLNAYYLPYNVRIFREIDTVNF